MDCAATSCCTGRRSPVSRPRGRGSANDGTGESQVRQSVIGDADTDAPKTPRARCLRHRRARSSTEREGAPSGNAASFSRPAYKLSNSRSDIESRSTPPTRSSARGRCNHRKRISAARGSETAFSRSPRSISASLGGSPLRRVARLSRLSRAALRASSCVHRCGRALFWSASASAMASASFSSAVSNRPLMSRRVTTSQWSDAPPA
jgi:hypothetical protein